VRSARSHYLAGALLIVLGVLLVAGSTALHAWGASNPPTSSGDAPPLTGAEQRALQHDRSAVATLPEAFREVPTAMADAAHSASGSPLSRTHASELLFEHPELGQLLKAIERPDALTSPLARGLAAQNASRNHQLLIPDTSLLAFFVVPGVVLIGLGLALRTRPRSLRAGRAVPWVCVLAGVAVLVGLLVPGGSAPAPWHAFARAPVASDADINTGVIQDRLATLEQVYDDVVPALQIAGAAGRQVLDPQSAVAVLSGNTHLVALDHFVTNFNSLYGAGVLISQQSASSSKGSLAPHAMRGLAWLGLVAGLVLMLAGFVWRDRRRHHVGDDDAPVDDGDIVGAPSNMAGSVA
jgi:hypothetical protein